MRLIKINISYTNDGNTNINSNNSNISKNNINPYQDK